MFIDHISAHPVRTVATVMYASWWAVSLGAVALGVAIGSGLLILVALIMIWRKVGKLEEHAHEHTDKMNTLTAKVGTLEQTLRSR